MANDPFVDVGDLPSLGPLRYLDVRDQAAFDGGHAPGAVRVPLDEWDAAAKAADTGFAKTASHRPDPNRQLMIASRRSPRLNAAHRRRSPSSGEERARTIGQIALPDRVLRHPHQPQRWSSRAPLPQSHDPHLARRPRRPHAIRSGGDPNSP